MYLKNSLACFDESRGLQSTKGDALTKKPRDIWLFAVEDHMSMKRGMCFSYVLECFGIERCKVLFIDYALEGENDLLRQAVLGCGDKPPDRAAFYTLVIHRPIFFLIYSLIYIFIQETKAQKK